jgi:hypothetical protein
MIRIHFMHNPKEELDSSIGVIRRGDLLGSIEMRCVSL